MGRGPGVRRSLTAALATGVTLDYVQQGDPTGLPVVLLPGLSDSWRSFEPMLAEFPAGLRVVAVSQRGHGQSSCPRSGYLPRDYAGDVISFLDALGIGRAVLVGHSSSCFTARLVAASHPQRTAGLVLIASPLALQGSPAATEMSTVLDALEDPVPAAFVREFARSTVGPSVSPSFLDAMVVESRRVPARVWRETFRGLLEHDDGGSLHRVVAPTLLVWGAADGLVSRDDQDVLAKALTSSRLLVYTATRHSPHWEHPARLAADVTAFVRGLAA